MRTYNFRVDKHKVDPFIIVLMSRKLHYSFSTLHWLHIQPATQTRIISKCNIHRQIAGKLPLITTLH